MTEEQNQTTHTHLSDEAGVELQQKLVLSAKRALGHVVCAIELQEGAVGCLIVCAGQSGEGLPKLLRESKVLRGIVLKLSYFHLVPDDQQMLGLQWKHGDEVHSSCT